MFRGWIPYALIGCLLATTECTARPDRAGVVATASMRVSRNPVPIGGPVDITLQFDVAPNATPFAEDGRVLMRLLFDDGEVMADYDHDPPTPTRDWHGGATVKYTRRVFVPDLPYVGSVPVLVGLYSAASGKRLLLAGKDQGNRAYKVGTLTLQAPTSLISFGAGWNREEYSNDPRVGWRWTEGEASMTARNPHRDSILYLRVDGRPDLFEAPQQVSLMRADRTIQRFSVTSATPTDHELALSADDLGSDDEVKLTLKVDRTFVPAQLPGGSSDTRVLGIRVFNAFLEPRSHE
jgi:hypothetical protein